MLTEHSPWEHSGGPDEGKEKVGGGEAHRRAYQVDPVSRWEMKVGACQWRWGLKLLGRGSVGRKMVQGLGCGWGMPVHAPGSWGFQLPTSRRRGLFRLSSSSLPPKCNCSPPYPEAWSLWLVDTIVQTTLFMFPWGNIVPSMPGGHLYVQYYRLSLGGKW